MKLSVKMCSRYTQTQKAIVLRSQSFGNQEFHFKLGFNISPGQQVDVACVEHGMPKSRQMRWGWHHKKFGSINSVEAHQAHHKVYQEAWRSGRCLIPADGYFQWKSGQPYRIVMVTGKPFWLAGLFNNGEVLILTAPAFGWLAANFDHTQPIALPERELDWWLIDAKEYRGHESWGVINRAISALAFEAYPVTPQITDVHFETPDCAVPISSANQDAAINTAVGHYHSWNDASEPPLPGNTVDLLLDDDTVTDGQWDGKDWQGLRFGNSCPIRWRRPRDPLYVNGNARSA